MPCIFDFILLYFSTELSISINCVADLVPGSSISATDRLLIFFISLADKDLNE